MDLDYIVHSQGNQKQTLNITGKPVFRHDLYCVYTQYRSWNFNGFWPCQTRSRCTKLYLDRVKHGQGGRNYIFTGSLAGSLAGSPAGRCPDHWPDNQPVAVRITCSWITGSLIHRVPVRKDVRITGRITIRIVIFYCFSSLPVTMLSVVTGSDGNSFHALKNVVL